MLNGGEPFAPLGMIFQARNQTTDLPVLKYSVLVNNYKQFLYLP